MDLPLEKTEIITMCPICLADTLIRNVLGYIKIIDGKCICYQCNWSGFRYDCKCKIINNNEE